MPTSFTFPIPWVMSAVKRLRPASILDVGCGAGRYGFLFREFLQYDRRQPAGPTRLDAIEIHVDYIGPVQRAIYDQVHIGPAQDVVPRLGRYDLVFCGDMIEHLAKDAGRRLLDELFAHAQRAVIITTPALWLEQGELFDNPAERHHSLWRARDFAAFANRRVCRIAGRILMAVLGREGVQLPRRLTPRPLRPRDRLKAAMNRWLGRSGAGPE